MVLKHNRSKTASLTAENTFCESIELQQGKKTDIRATGIVDSIVTFQLSRDRGGRQDIEATDALRDAAATWEDVEGFTSNFYKQLTVDRVAVYGRIGIKTGDYGTDTVVPIIGQ